MIPHFQSLTSAYQLHFYSWFKTAYRRPLLLTESSKTLTNDVINEVCARENFHLLDTDIAKDHLKLLISLKPDQDVSNAVKLLKGNVSRRFGLEFSSLLKAQNCRRLWASGYFARSTGKVNLVRAREYLESQVSHHGYKGKWTGELTFRNPAFKSPAFRLAHALCMLDYHLVLATQNRLPIFDEVIAPQLFKYVMAIGRKHQFAVDRMSVMPDHVHLIVEAVPDLSVEKCVLALLENTRHWITGNYAGVLKELEAWDVWEPSYYAGTVGEFSTAQVRNFLRTS